MSEQEFNRVFANNLKNKLSESGMTRAEFAEKVGVGISSVGFWTSGTKTPRMDKIDKMCEIFHCKRSDLLEEKTEPEDRPHYIIDPDAENMIVDMYENPDLRVVFDCARKVKPEDLEQVAKLIKTFIPEDDNDHIC